MLYQLGHNLKIFPSEEVANKNIHNNKSKEKFLCKINLIQDYYEIIMKENNSSLNSDEDKSSFKNIDIDNEPWIISKYVFENNREHGYKMHKGDIFKLGKYILKVKEIGIDEEDKRIIIERKNTQKFIKNKKNSNNNINNISQIPLNNNQHDEDYSQVLNLNNNMNNRMNENDNNHIIHFNINQIAKNNNNDIEESEKEGSKENNIHIIDHEDSKIEENSNCKSNSNSSKIKSSNNNENNNNLNFLSVVNANQENFNNSNDKNNNMISVFYNDNQNNKSNININNIQGDNKNLYFINIIKNNSESNESNNKLNDNSFKVNSFGINTFKKDSLKNSSMSKSNFQSLKLNETIEENNNEKVVRNNQKYLTVQSTSKIPISKNPQKELKSTASFNKQKILDHIQNKILNETQTKSKPLCRICLSEEHEKENPLIHPCNCDGTMKYIHLQCLRLLIQSKIKKTETESCKVLTFKRLECEICKMAFPEKISIKGALFSIIDIDKPDKDYIILEGLIKEIPEEKSIFIVHFKNKKEIKIGRATDANIRLNDISVSRAHANIKQYNDSFYLHDTNSKFGTLIRMKNKFKIFCDKPFYVQKGNTFYEFIMKKTFWAYFKCYKQKSDTYLSYNDFFDDIFLSKYSYKKNEDIFINEKTKSVSEYSSEAVVKYNKIDMNSVKNYIFSERKVNNINIIQISKKDNKELTPKIVFDSFRFNKKKIKDTDNSHNNIIDKTQENSNVLQISKKDSNQSKSREEINKENQINDNSLSLENVPK